MEQQERDLLLPPLSASAVAPSVRPSVRPAMCTSRAFPPKGTQTLTEHGGGESRGGRGDERASERPTSNEGGNISLSLRLHARAPTSW